MAQPASNPKIEELRFRVKTDPKSRLFYPLAEELRRINRFDEAEQVLRAGLTHHASYLSAWVSLGRVLREQDKHRDAVEALTKALQIDPGNVVVARLLADCYLALGDRVEAIKKYKLVRALLPADEGLAGIIAQIERELHPIVPLEVSALPPVYERLVTEEMPFMTDDGPASAKAAIKKEQRKDEATGDAEPMRAAHAASPFEDPATDYTAATLDVERPPGMHVESAPLAADIPAPWHDEEAASDVFAPAEAATPPADDLTTTLTMADLYVQQGLPDQARPIYERILQRDPDNRAVRDKLESLAVPQPAKSETKETNPKVAKLEEWLAKVKQEEGRV
jgi:tetratricopeptide (TPR) repeat protein